jgi:2-polyprenyl-6-methoxyphenol hydroxylase-like FAD-dependent oxidoreductase
MTVPTPAVLVAGAGPTGLTLAISLALHGVAVRIVDRLAAPAGVSKALAVWPGSLEAFSALGVVDGFLAAGIHMQHLRIGDGERQLAEIDVGEGVDSAYPFTLILPQSRTETLLAARLAALGVTIERGVELVGFSQNESGVIASLKHADGHEETTEAAFLVGCDGARSAVRRGLGVEFEGKTEPQTFILSDTRMDGGLDPRSIYIWSGARGSVALFPVEGDIWRTFALREEPATDEPPTLEEIQAHLDGAGPPGVVARDPVWLSAFHINERQVSSYREGRVLLAGDAAHIHSPAGGQGMNTGVQDAVNLGWKLAAVIAGCGEGEALLASYEAERRPVAAHVVANATRMLHFGMVAQGTATRLIRGALVSIAARIPAVRRAMQVELSETDIAYDAGPLVEIGRSTSGTGSPAVGTRARDVEVVDGEAGTPRRLWRLLSASKHTLLVFGDPAMQSALMAEALSHAATVEIVMLDSLSDPRGLAAERYGITGTGWVLVRPDQFIAARGAGGETRAFSAYAGRALERAPA